MLTTSEMLLKEDFYPKLLNNPLYYCFLINLNNTTLHIPIRSIIFRLFVFRTLGYLLSLSFCTLNNMLTLFYT